MNKKFYYKKSLQGYISAKALNILPMFKALGEVIHEDDLDSVASLLELDVDAVKEVFYSKYKEV